MLETSSNQISGISNMEYLQELPDYWQDGLCPTQPVTHELLNKSFERYMVCALFIGIDVDSRLSKQTKIVEEIRKSDPTIKLRLWSANKTTLMTLEWEAAVQHKLVKSELVKANLTVSELFEPNSIYERYIKEMYFQLNHKAAAIALRLGECIAVENVTRTVDGVTKTYQIAIPTFIKTKGYFDIAKDKNGLVCVCQTNKSMPTMDTFVFGKANNTQFTYKGKNDTLVGCNTNGAYILPIVSKKQDLHDFVKTTFKFKELF